METGQVCSIFTPEIQLMTQVQLSVQELFVGKTNNRTQYSSCTAFKRIQRNYQKVLWSAALVNMAASWGQITSDEATAILND